MAMNPLPPQAYTKDTMLKAYSWLQNQNDNIKELATTPDILVSLFLKANRDGDSSLERPSIQNFKNELKSIAGLMGEFENQANPQAFASTISTPGQTNISIQMQAPAPLPGHMHTQMPSHNTQVPPPSAHYASQQNLGQAGVSSAPPFSGSSASAGPTTTEANSTLALDELSLSMIREVKNQLNLSSDHEAIRALIRLGHLQISRLFK